MIELVVFSPGGKSLNKVLGNHDKKVGDCVGKCPGQTHNITAILLI